jgi:hypothetical protein
MAGYVERNGCGRVVESVSPEGVLTAVEALARNYEDLQQAARRVGQVDFSQAAMLGSFQRVYERVLGCGMIRS